MSTGIDLAINGERWIIDLIAPRSEFFVDVGANVGRWSLEFAGSMSHPPRGLAYEPSPLAIPYLQKALSGLANENVEVVQKAIGSVQGRRPFFAEPDHGETSSLLKEHASSSAVETVVDIARLDDELRSRRIDFVDFLKIDAEGLDMSVLQGAEKYIKENKINVVQFEYNSAWALSGSTLQSAVKFLEGYKYKIYLLKGSNLLMLNPTKYGEYFSYSNFIAYCSGRHAIVLDRLEKAEI